MKKYFLILLMSLFLFSCTTYKQPRQTRKNPLGLHPRVTSINHCGKKSHKYKGNTYHKKVLFNSNKVYKRK